MKTKGQFKVIGSKKVPKSSGNGTWFIADVRPVDAYSGQVDTKRGDEFEEKFPLFLELSDPAVDVLDKHVEKVVELELDVCVGTYRDGEAKRTYPRHQVRLVSAKPAMAKAN